MAFTGVPTDAPKSTPLWELARQIQLKLQEGIDNNLHFMTPTMHETYASLGRTLGTLNSKAYGQFISWLNPEGFNVSNLGRCEFDLAGTPFYVESFGLASNTTILNYFSSSVATLNGKMIWTFNGSSPTLSRSHLEQFAERVIQRIGKAL